MQMISDMTKCSATALQIIKLRNTVDRRQLSLARTKLALAARARDFETERTADDRRRREVEAYITAAAAVQGGQDTNTNAQTHFEMMLDSTTTAFIATLNNNILRPDTYDDTYRLLEVLMDMDIPAQPRPPNWSEYLRQVARDFDLLAADSSRPLDDDTRRAIQTLVHNIGSEENTNRKLALDNIRRHIQQSMEYAKAYQQRLTPMRERRRYNDHFCNGRRYPFVDVRDQDSPSLYSCEGDERTNRTKSANRDDGGGEDTNATGQWRWQAVGEWWIDHYSEDKPTYMFLLRKILDSPLLALYCAYLLGSLAVAVEMLWCKGRHIAAWFFPNRQPFGQVLLYGYFFHVLPARNDRKKAIFTGDAAVDAEIIKVLDTDWVAEVGETNAEFVTTHLITYLSYILLGEDMWNYNPSSSTESGSTLKKMGAKLMTRWGPLGIGHLLEYAWASASGDAPSFADYLKDGVYAQEDNLFLKQEERWTSSKIPHCDLFCALTLTAQLVAHRNELHDLPGNIRARGLWRGLVGLNP